MPGKRNESPKDRVWEELSKGMHTTSSNNSGKSTRQTGSLPRCFPPEVGLRSKTYIMVASKENGIVFKGGKYFMRGKTLLLRTLLRVLRASGSVEHPSALLLGRGGRKDTLKAKRKGDRRESSSGCGGGPAGSGLTGGQSLLLLHRGGQETPTSKHE